MPMDNIGEILAQTGHIMVSLPGTHYCIYKNVLMSMNYILVTHNVKSATEINNDLLYL